MKIKIGPLPYIYPIPITLVEADIAGKPNFATIGDVGLISVGCREGQKLIKPNDD